MDRSSEPAAAPQDRRRAKRTHTPGLELLLYNARPRLRAARIWNRTSSPEDATVVAVVDLSLGGARLQVPAGVALEVGQLVELAVDEDCRNRAVVRHVEPSEGGLSVGVEFIAVPNPAISPFFQRVVAAVENLGVSWDEPRTDFAEVEAPRRWSAEIAPDEETTGR